jgi:PAP2 superfamily protein
MTHLKSVVATLVIFSLFGAIPTAAQELETAAFSQEALQRQARESSQQPAQDGQQVAVPAGSKKETRGFFGALVHNLGDDLKHMPRRNSLYWLAAGGAGALAIHPVDDEINQHLVGSDFADTFFVPGKVLGSTEFVLGAAFATYIVGRRGSKERVQHLGMDLIEATLLSEGITEAIKYSVRRQRPLNPDGSQQSSYAFPSGHATVTFAAATVLQQHLGWRAAVPTYLVASYVAMSRLHDNRHWASDVVFGSTDGIIIGRSVTWHGRNFYAMPTFVPHGAGVMVALAP